MTGMIKIAITVDASIPPMTVLEIPCRVESGETATGNHNLGLFIQLTVVFHEFSSMTAKAYAWFKLLFASL
jgi:hypothetical protein